MPELLLTPIVFLITAVLLVPLAQRLGLGSVLGYLVGGCIIGPWGLALVRRVEMISEVAEIGVVLMLFLIGLELQPKKLLAMRRMVLGGGALQLLACGLPLAGAAWLLGLGTGAALVAGATLALSSTAIAVQSMQERHIDNTAAGNAAFAILLFQDMAAIPLLVITPILGGGGSGQPAFSVTLAVVAVPPLLRLIARTRLREIFTAFALLLVLGIAQVMTLADLSMGLGAFLAGVLLASSEYRKALEADLEPFKGLLLGLFFTSVGMAANLGLLAGQPLLVLGLAAGFMLLKMVVLGVIARFTPVAPVQRWPFAAVLAQGSEFAFVVFGVGRAAGVLTPRWDELLVLMVAVSMALTPLAVFAGDRLAGALNRTEKPAPDTIEPEGARVIVAGFGRVGQIAARLLIASGFKVTILDNDPDLIESLRRFGFRLFYGDATRLDLLQAAEADKAHLLINAIDDMESNLKLTELAKQYFPHLKIIARARNLSHLYELKSRGVELIERETFESALLMGQRALEQMGVPSETAERARVKFREHNLSTIEAIQPYYQDEKTRISMGQAALEELARSFEQDRLRLGDGKQ
jgi:glutathione-regulated potassium-efflux system ancillary protein KefC